MSLTYSRQGTHISAEKPELMTTLFLPGEGRILRRTAVTEN